MKYLAIYYLFETQVCHVTRVLETRVFWKNSLQICRAIFYGTWVTSKIFYGTRVCKTRVTLQSWVSQTRVSQIIVDPYIFVKQSFLAILAGTLCVKVSHPKWSCLLDLQVATSPSMLSWEKRILFYFFIRLNNRSTPDFL